MESTDTVRLMAFDSLTHRTVDSNEQQYTLPEEQEEQDWYTAGYYHEDEDGR